MEKPININFLDIISFFLNVPWFLVDMCISDTIQRDLNKDTLSFYNDIVLQFGIFGMIMLVSLKVKILIAPILSSLRKEVSAPKLFDSAL
jgi:hypothetical protein